MAVEGMVWGTVVTLCLGEAKRSYLLVDCARTGLLYHLIRRGGRVSCVSVLWSRVLLASGAPD
jgi:hypothetical protein